MLFKSLVRMIRGTDVSVGVDVSSHAVRAVRLSRGKDGEIVCEALGHIDVDVFSAGQDEIKRVKDVIDRVRGDIRRVSISIEDSSLRIRRMRIPVQSKRDALAMIRDNFSHHMDISMDHFEVNYSPLEGVAESGEPVVMAVGVSSEAIAFHVEAAKRLGFRIKTIQPVATSVVNAFDAVVPHQKNRFVALLLFDEGISYFMVVHRGMLFFSRLMSGLTLENLVELLMQRLSFDKSRARSVLHGWFQSPSAKSDSIVDAASQKAFHSAIECFCDKFSGEVKRSIAAFSAMYNDSRIDEICVCGSGAKCPGVKDHLGEILGIKTGVLNPFDRMKMSDAGRAGSDFFAPSYTVVVGLAVSEWIGHRLIVR